MSSRGRPAGAPPPRRTSTRASLLRSALAGMLGIAAALLVSCGGSSAKLIPVADAGPLQSDFETVAQDAEAGNGSCTATEAAVLKTEHDFSALPASVDSGLRQTLRQGIENLRARALVLCVQPLVQTTPTSSTPKTTTSTSTSTTTGTTTPTTSTPTTTTPTTSTPSTTTPTSTSPGGGTPAPGETPAGGGAPGGGTGAGEGGAGGASAQEGAAGAGAGGAGGQEGAK
ncbi:MAG TPA: hypothetical protein VK790_04410 [Solirubrobacteraceae bacterium]|jgi:hypothetical protein|nr:hypothetical protein [Solirubrobacteraceae bacterium]